MATEKEKREFREIWEEANDRGTQRANEALIQYMRAHDPYSGRKYPPFPICGFAWVTVKPATIKFARWLKEENLGVTSPRGGVVVWIDHYGQAYDKKLAHARGIAEVLNQHGINAEAEGRLD